MRILKLLLLLWSFIKQSSALGEVVIHTSPKSLVWHNWRSGYMLPSEGFVVDMVSAALGLTVQEAAWNGLNIENPWKLATSAFLLIIDGQPSFFTENSTTTKFKPRYGFKIERGGSNKKPVLSGAAAVLSERIRRKTGEPKVISIEFEDHGNRIGRVLAKPMDLFLDELESLRALKTKMRIEDVVIVVRFRSLHRLVDELGPLSPEVKRATDMLWYETDILAHESSTAHSDSSLTMIISGMIPHTHSATFQHNIGKVDTDENDEKVKKSTRVKRSADPEGNPKVARDITNDRELVLHSEPLSDTPFQGEIDEFSDDYEYQYQTYESSTGDHHAAMFNIVLWLSFTLGFTLCSIVYVFMDMDPGRDSIVYRMTMPRGVPMFKQNLNYK